MTMYLLKLVMPTEFISMLPLLTASCFANSLCQSRLIRESAASVGAAVGGRLCAPLVHRSARCVSEIRDLPHGARFATHDDNVDVLGLVVWRDERSEEHTSELQSLRHL